MKQPTSVGVKEANFADELCTLLKLPPAKRHPLMKCGSSYAQLSSSRMYDLYTVRAVSRS